MKITDYVKPIGWTRDTNLSGYLSGTYDVLAVWPNGPEKEVWSHVGMYSQAQVEEILKRSGICEDHLKKILESEKVTN